jgi:hypothetical protein
MRDAKAHKFGLVIVARFDRFARSTTHLLRALDEFQQRGIDFVSLSENIDTGTAVGKMIFTVLGAVAELERNLIRERVAMGIARAKKQGKTLGRPQRIFDPTRPARSSPPASPYAKSPAKSASPAPSSCAASRNPLAPETDSHAAKPRRRPSPNPRLRPFGTSPGPPSPQRAYRHVSAPIVTHPHLVVSVTSSSHKTR